MRLYRQPVGVFCWQLMIYKQPGWDNLEFGVNRWRCGEGICGEYVPGEEARVAISIQSLMSQLPDLCIGSIPYHYPQCKRMSSRKYVRPRAVSLQKRVIVPHEIIWQGCLQPDLTSVSEW
jgi:hypothetical protein